MPKKDIINVINIDSVDSTSDNRRITGTIPLGELSRNGYYYDNGAFGNNIVYELPSFIDHGSYNTLDNLDTLIGNAKIIAFNDHLEFEIQLNGENDEIASKVWDKVKAGNIKFVSTSAMQNAYFYDEKDIKHITKADLIELSLTATPGFKNAKIQNFDNIKIEEKKIIEKKDTNKGDNMPKVLNTISDCIDAKKELKVVLEDKLNQLSGIENQMKDTSNMTPEEVANLAEDKLKLDELVATTQKDITNIDEIETRIQNKNRDAINKARGTNFAQTLSNDDVQKEDNFLRKVQKNSIDLEDETFPVTIWQEILTVIETSGKILPRVTSKYNANNESKILVFTSDRQVNKAQYGTYNNDTETNVTAGAYFLEMITFSDYIPVDEKVRTMALPELRKLIIDTLSNAIITQLEFEIIAGNDKNATTGESYGIQGAGSKWSIDKKITIPIPVTTKLEISDITNARPHIKSNQKLDLIINPFEYAALIDTAKDSPNDYVFKQLENYNIVQMHELPTFATASTEVPFVVIGDFKTFKLEFAKGTMMQIGSTPQNRNRNNELFVHSDVKGSGTKETQFVALFNSTAMPAGATASSKAGKTAQKVEPPKGE